MVAVDEGVEGKNTSGVIELHRLYRTILVAEFIHPVLDISTCLPTECFGLLTDGLKSAPFGCNGFRQRVITLLFYRLSSAKIVLGTIIEANYYSIHDHSLEKRDKSMLQ